MKKRMLWIAAVLLMCASLTDCVPEDETGTAAVIPLTESTEESSEKSGSTEEVLPTEEATSTALTAETETVPVSSEEETESGSSEPRTEADFMPQDAYRILAEGSGMTFTLEYDQEARESFVLTEAKAGTYNQYVLEHLAVLMREFEWKRADEVPEVKESKVFKFASSDGMKVLTIRAEGNLNIAEYDDGTAYCCWSAPQKKMSFSEKMTDPRTLADLFRHDYDLLEADATKICFSLDGNAEDAVRYFTEEAFPEARRSLHPENEAAIVDYRNASYVIDRIAEDGKSVIGSFWYEFTYRCPRSAGSTHYDSITEEGIDTSKYEGWQEGGWTFLLELQEDGYWHCAGIGTGPF